MSTVDPIIRLEGGAVGVVTGGITGSIVLEEVSTIPIPRETGVAAWSWI